MVREARAAYRRRDEELAQRKEQVEKSHAETPTAEGARRAERSWWEAAGIDGGADSSMSPVAEEVSNPMEDIILPSPRRK